MLLLCCPSTVLFLLFPFFFIFLYLPSGPCFLWQELSPTLAPFTHVVFATHKSLGGASHSCVLDVRSGNTRDVPTFHVHLAGYCPDWRCRACLSVPAAADVGPAPDIGDIAHPLADVPLDDLPDQRGNPDEPAAHHTTHINLQHLPPPSLNFLQFNCNGIQHGHRELSSYLHDKQILVACLQETKLTSTSKTPSFANYNMVRKDGPSQDGGGGLAILVHHSISFFPFNCQHRSVLPT